MIAKRALLALTCGSLILTLTACPPGQKGPEDSTAEFYIASTGLAGNNGYTANGWGWKPNSKVEISIWHEPDGPDSAATQWKKVMDVNVDGIGMFGFGGNPPFYPVRRNICGTPVQGQTALFMAKSVTTGKISMRQVPVDIYFTFQPCR